MQNIIIQYFSWHFFEMPREILKAWKNFLLFNLDYFSVPLLFKTFFFHWRKYRWSYGTGFDLTRYLETFFSNLISRILGAVVRTFAIIIGLLAEIGLFFGGLIVFLGWLVLPAFLIVGLIFGIKIVF